MYDPDLSIVDNVRMTPTTSPPDGLHKVSFIPHRPGKYVICAAEDKVSIDDTPFSVCLNVVSLIPLNLLKIEVLKAVDLNKLHVYGPGVGSNVFSGQTTSFAIDARGMHITKLDLTMLI